MDMDMGMGMGMDLHGLLLLPLSAAFFALLLTVRAPLLHHAMHSPPLLLNTNTAVHHSLYIIIVSISCSHICILRVLALTLVVSCHSSASVSRQVLFRHRFRMFFKLRHGRTHARMGLLQLGLLCASFCEAFFFPAIPLHQLVRGI